MSGKSKSFTTCPAWQVSSENYVSARRPKHVKILTKPSARNRTFGNKFPCMGWHAGQCERATYLLSLWGWRGPCMGWHAGQCERATYLLSLWGWRGPCMGWHASMRGLPTYYLYEDDEGPVWDGMPVWEGYLPTISMRMTRALYGMACQCERATYLLSLWGWRGPCMGWHASMRGLYLLSLWGWRGPCMGWHASMRGLPTYYLYEDDEGPVWDGMPVWEGYLPTISMRMTRALYGMACQYERATYLLSLWGWRGPCMGWHASMRGLPTYYLYEDDEGHAILHVLPQILHKPRARLLLQLRVHPRYIRLQLLLEYRTGVLWQQHSLSQHGVWVSFGNPNPQKWPLRTPINVGE